MYSCPSPEYPFTLPALVPFSTHTFPKTTGSKTVSPPPSLTPKKGEMEPRLLARLIRLCVAPFILTFTEGFFDLSPVFPALPGRPLPLWILKTQKWKVDFEPSFSLHAGLLPFPHQNLSTNFSFLLQNPVFPLSSSLSRTIPE